MLYQLKYNFIVVMFFRIMISLTIELVPKLLLPSLKSVSDFRGEAGTYAHLSNYKAL